MQCKTRHSCENNKAQNFHQKPPSTPGTKSNNLLVYAWYQCQPNGTGQNKDSVCRQCCQTDKEYTQSTDFFVQIGDNLVSDTPCIEYAIYDISEPSLVLDSVILTLKSSFSPKAGFVPFVKKLQNGIMVVK